jgi:long-chain alkane monooxygenase
MSRHIVLNACDMNCVGHIQHGMWTHPRDKSINHDTLGYWQNPVCTGEHSLFATAALRRP